MGEAGGGWGLQDLTAGVISMDRSPQIGVIIFFHSLMALELGTPPLLQHLELVAPDPVRWSRGFSETFEPGS